MAKYTKKDIEKLNKFYKKIFKSSGCRILSNEEMTNINESMSLLSSGDVKIIEDSKNGNYAKINDASALVRNYIATLAWKSFVNETQSTVDTISLSNEQIKKYVQGHVLDAGFRLGLSAMKHSLTDNNNLVELDEYANEYLLTKTLSLPSKENVDALSARIGEKAANNEVAKNSAKQIVLAKTLFLAQLGKYSLNENDQQTDYLGSIAETFAHGGRTNFILPPNDIKNDVLDAFEGGEIGKTAEIKSRIAATHSATQRKVNTDLSIAKESNEEKPKITQVGKIFRNQYGMNVAIGGIGEIGPNQKAILSDGSAGHMYIRKQKGDANTCPSLLIGIESAASLKTSFTGHFHTPLAKSSKQSAFLADKFGPGSKTNGKTVDLSGLDSEKLALALKEFEKGYIALQNSNNSNKLYELNEMLSGKRMSETQMLDMMTDVLGISKDVSSEIVMDARKGLDARIQRERDNLSNQFKNVLGSDLCSEATTQSIKVMQKTKDDRWVLTNLFDPNDTLEQRHSKFCQSLDKGEQLYLTSNTKSTPTKINVTNKNIAIGESAEKIIIAAPKEPSRIQKVLHNISRGLLFNSTMNQYAAQKEEFEKQAVINSFIDEHKAVVEQSQKTVVSADEQATFREKLEKLLAENIEMEKSPRTNNPVSKEKNTPEL